MKCLAATRQRNARCGPRALLARYGNTSSFILAVLAIRESKRLNVWHSRRRLVLLPVAYSPGSPDKFHRPKYHCKVRCEQNDANRQPQSACASPASFQAPWPIPINIAKKKAEKVQMRLAIGRLPNARECHPRRLLLRLRAWGCIQSAIITPPASSVAA